ncbi:MAG TPA: cellulose binding domain-containing protein, partial [Terracidiphilus sp.]
MTVFAALLLTLVAPSALAQCGVVYTISPQNNTTFGAAITLNNTGTTAWTSWTLTWTFANGQTISSLWNGNETQSGSSVMMTNESYNGSVPVGGSVTGIGFNGTWNGSTNAVPTNLAVNGVACNGGGGGNPGSFSLTAGAVSVEQSATATDAVTVTDINGFTGAVALAVSGLP